MPLHSSIIPRSSVYDLDRHKTVLSLDTYLGGQVDAPSFFEENYFTSGMEVLVDRVFRYLGSGQSGSSVFLLSQSMGGGKTHSMIGLGLLAENPTLRADVLGESNPAPSLGEVKVIGFNGRDSDAPGGIWGALAEQLDQQSVVADYCSPLLKAPSPAKWKQVLGEQPLIILLDELPPYLENAVAIAVGNGDLGLVTTTALANLFVAVAEMPNACLILSDLAGSNYSRGSGNLQNAFDSATQGISSEARRIATPITPVNPNGDELYHILRKRLFTDNADKQTIESVASAYRDALKQANQMDLTSTSPESLHSRLIESYPFHPDLRGLVGKFKENDGFQQTRGVIRFMQMIVADLWKSDRAKEIDLIHPYDFDLNKDEISSEIRTINPSLSEAIAHDIAHSGAAECEEIDQANGSSDATDAAKLVLMASFSTTPGAVAGLREFELIDCLQRPGRNLSTFQAQVLDKLATRAWYLHRSADGRLYFKNQENLAAKLRSTAQSLNREIIDRMVRDHLEEFFKPTLRDCYQHVHVLPPRDEVQLDHTQTTLVIVRPGGNAQQLPISIDWQDWWSQQQFKNRVVFLSGSRDTYERVLESARRVRALESIEDELKVQQTAPDDPQWKSLDELKSRIGLQFTSALKEAFDQVVYPSINSALRAKGIDLAFANNSNGEATIRQTLESAPKFTTDTSADSFAAKAEARLFGGGESVLWSDFKREAAVRTDWPLHSPTALDSLKADCIRRDRWREEGSYIRKGPFPDPDPEVSIRLLSRNDEGVCFLKIEPLHAPNLSYEEGDLQPTPQSPPVPTPSSFEASRLLYQFFAFDPDDLTRQSEVRTWKAQLEVRHQLDDRGDYQEVTLQSLPQAGSVSVHYTTDGSSPTNAGAATYDGPIRVPETCRILQAVAICNTHGLSSEVRKITIAQKDEAGGGESFDKTAPTTWKGKTNGDDSGKVWQLIDALAMYSDVRARTVSLTAESADGEQLLDFAGSRDSGYSAEELRTLANQLQELSGPGSLRLKINQLEFLTGQKLLDWLRDRNEPFESHKATQ